MNSRVVDVLVVWMLVAVVLGICWWMWSDSHQRSERGVQDKQEDWMTVRQFVPTDANLVECGKCLVQCKWAIDKHVYTSKELKP